MGHWVTGTFQPFGPAGALRRRLLHRNGTFVPPAPSTPLRRQVKTDFRQKFSSIRTIPRGKTTEISVRTQPSIRFFPLPARNGSFRPFFGPQRAHMEHTLLVSHPEGAMSGQAECTQVTLFPYKYWVFEEKSPVSGLPEPKRVSGNCRK